MFEHIVVYGAGAIGSIYAAKLAASHDVTVVARREHVAAIRAGGLHLTGCEETTIQVRAVTDLETIEPQTLVVLTTKVHANRAAALAMAGQVRSDTVILCVQNGLGGEEIVKGVVGDRCLVLRAITHFGAIFRTPGVIEYKVAGHTLIEHGPRSREIAALLSACGLDGRVSQSIKHDIWRKLIINCVINPITSMIGGEVGGIASPGLGSLKRLIVDECLAVARADGVTFDFDFVEMIDRVFQPSRNIASMRQDLLNGRATEIDHLNGAVADLGRRSGIACPVNAAVVAIIKALEAMSIRPTAPLPDAHRVAQ
jgi:2-dehydropantoate 2-reductase